MKKKTILILLLLFVLGISSAQNPYKGEITVEFESSELQAGEVSLKANIDVSKLRLNHNDILLFSPRLVSLDGAHEVAFEPVSLSGKRRAGILSRDSYFRKEASSEMMSENFHIVTRKNPMAHIPLTYKLPFEKWMRNSRLVIQEQTFGCYTCRNKRLYADGQQVKLYESDPYNFPEPYQPQYKVIYITPPVEEVKILRDTYSAQLQFPVNRSELLPTFGNNQRVLSEVDDVIERIRKDTLLTVRKITVLGYASPEGGAAHNLRLSQDRAKAFVDYLYRAQNYRVSDRLITSQGMGEDWEGLKKAVSNLESPDRYKVLQILDSNANVERRKNALKGLTGDITYRMLLENIYPPLRRNEYTIEYEVRGFTPEEAKEIIHTRPKLLSLNEMFMVAHLYENGTKEFLDVFDIAAQLYPESSFAQFNVATSEIERKDFDGAILRLKDMNTPEALNNLAIAYWHKGQYEKTLELLEKASALDSQEARFNLQEYRKWDNDRY